MGPNRTKKVFGFLAAAVLWITLVGFNLIPLLFFFTFRFLVHISAWLFRPDLIPIYNPLDHLIITAPSNKKSQVNVSASLILKGPLNVWEFRKHFENTFLSSKELRKRYSNLYCYYVQYGLYMFKKSVTEINIIDRIKETTIEINRFGEVEEFIGKYVELQDYGENPNWEILLIHVNLDNRDGNDPEIYRNLVIGKQPTTIVVLKFHYGMCDGYSLIHVVDTLCGNKSPYLVKDSKSTLWDKIWMLYNMPLSILKLAMDLRKCGKMPWPEIGDEGVDKMYMSFTQLELKKLKRVRKLAECHFCTLLCVIQAEASRRFFISKGLEHMLPDYVCVGTPLGRPGHPVTRGGGMQNHLSSTALQVNMKGDDLVSKLLEAESSYCRLAEEFMLLEIFYRFLLPLFWPIPRSFLDRIFIVTERMDLTTKMEHGITPNVISSDDYNLLGVPVQSIYPHVRVSSFVKYPKLQMMTFSDGEYVNATVGGRQDSYQNKEEIDFIAKVLMRQVLDDILKAFETAVKIKDDNHECVLINGYHSSV